MNLKKSANNVRRYYGLNDEASTQGRHGTASTVIVNDEERILYRLRNLSKDFDDLCLRLLETFDIRSILTLCVENVFSELRSGTTDMPLQLEFDRRFPRAVRERERVPQKTVHNLSKKYNPRTLPLHLYEEACDSNISLKDLNSFNSTVQSNSNTSSKTTIHFQLGMIVCIKSKRWRISKLSGAVFIDQNGHIVPGKVKAVSFIKDVILVNRFSEGPEEGIATKDILCLVENTSVRVAED